VKSALLVVSPPTREAREVGMVVALVDKEPGGSTRAGIEVFV